VKGDVEFIQFCKKKKDKKKKKIRHVGVVFVGRAQACTFLWVQVQVSDGPELGKGGGFFFVCTL